MAEPQASVVIAFKDWGLERLERCIRSILNSFGDVPAEVIVSDYGSADGRAVAEAARQAGGRSIRTETDGTWSKSLALNTGFAAAVGEQFFSIDADMIFPPGGLATVSQRLIDFPNEAVILQCRDLPADYVPPGLSEVDWLHCERIATLRPRWGMGGMVASQREIFERLRGYDERMHTYGGEDTDYGKRLVRAGIPINWLDTNGVRMFHVWHPSSQFAAALDKKAQAAVNENRRIHMEDKTTARNRLGSEQLDAVAPPIVTIVVPAARERDSLSSEINAILGQTISAIEIIIADLDGTGQEIAQELQDDRIKVVTTLPEFWWHSIVDARGTFVMLHSSGSWSPANRMEKLLHHTTERHLIPADTLITAISAPRDDLIPVPATSGILHRRPWAALAIPTSAARAVMATLSPAARDPHDLVYALLRNGFSIEPVEDSFRVDIMPAGPGSELELNSMAREVDKLHRRLTAADIDSAWLRASPSPSNVQAALQQATLSLEKEVDVDFWGTNRDGHMRISSALGAGAAVKRSRVSEPSGEPVMWFIKASGVPATVVEREVRKLSLRQTGEYIKYEFVNSKEFHLYKSVQDRLIEEYSLLYANSPESAIWIAVRTQNDESAINALQAVQGVEGIIVALHRIVHEEDDATPTHLILGLVGANQSTLSSLSTVVCRLPDDAFAEAVVAASLDLTSLESVMEARG